MAPGELRRSPVTGLGCSLALMPWRWGLAHHRFRAVLAVPLCASARRGPGRQNGSVSDETTFTPEWFANLPSKPVAAGCVFVDERDRILLVAPTYKGSWEIPGGVVEDGESPLDACRREVIEELGVDWRPTGFLGVDYRVAVDGVRGDALRFVFTRRIASEDAAAITLAAAEISEWRFVPPEDLDDYLIAPMAARLRSLLAGAAYLEEGVNVLTP